MPAIDLDLSTGVSIIAISVGLGPYLVLDSHFQYPPYEAGISPYQSLYYFGSCNVPHFMEYQILGGLEFEYNVSILNGKYVKGDSFSVYKQSVLSGCFLSQNSKIFTLSFLLEHPGLPDDMSVLRALLVTDFQNSLNSVSVYQFPKVDFVKLNNYFNVTLYLGDDNGYKSEDLFVSASAIVRDPKSLLYSSDRYLSKYIVQKVDAVTSSSTSSSVSGTTTTTGVGTTTIAGEASGLYQP